MNLSIPVYEEKIESESSYWALGACTERTRTASPERSVSPSPIRDRLAPREKINTEY
jgi:hypothetical protein